jgi:drug/metabolite transporter (DMT)-like permease
MIKSRLWLVLLTLAAAAAGSIYPITKLLVVEISPLSLAFLRYFLAVLPLTPFFLVEYTRKKVRIPARDYTSMLSLGLLGVAGFSLAFFYGVNLSTSSNGSVLINTQPIFAAFLAPLLVDERFTLKSILGSALGIVGILLVVTGGRWSALSFEKGVLLGNIILLGASLSLTLYSILLKRYITRYGGVIPTFVTMVSGTLALCIVVLSVQGYLFHIRSLTGFEILFLLYIGFFCTAYFFLVFNRALHEVGVVESIGFKLLIPIFGVVLSMIILGERPLPLSYAGMGVVIVSLVVIQLRLRTSDRSSQKSEGTMSNEN